MKFLRWVPPLSWVPDEGADWVGWMRRKLGESGSGGGSLLVLLRMCLCMCVNICKVSGGDGYWVPWWLSELIDPKCLTVPGFSLGRMSLTAMRGTGLWELGHWVGHNIRVVTRYEENYVEKITFIELNCILLSLLQISTHPLYKNFDLLLNHISLINQISSSWKLSRSFILILFFFLEKLELKIKHF